MPLALIAPRLLYLASAAEDLWADPDSEFASALAADEAYRAMNVEGLARKRPFRCRARPAMKDASDIMCGRAAML